MDFHSTVLKNGLTVLAEVQPHALSSSVGFYVKTGARDETPSSGVSHFQEHMSFKGTGEAPPDQIRRTLAEIGARCNAYTSWEYTVYHLGCLPRFVREGLRILSTLVSHGINRTEFYSEQGVVLEEIERSRDNPWRALSNAALPAYFGKHPAGQSILGTRETVSALTPESVLEYKRKQYSPTNMILVGAGKLDWPSFVAIAEELCGRWKPVVVERFYPEWIPPAEFSRVDLCAPNLQSAYIAMFGAGPSASDPLSDAAKILGAIMTSSPSSLAYWQLIQPGLARSVSLSHLDLDRVGAFWLTAECAKVNVELVLEKLYRLLTHPSSFKAKDLTRVKGWLSAMTALGGQTPDARMSSLGHHWLTYRSYASVQDDCRAIEAVTMDDIARYLSVFPLSPKLVVTRMAE